MSELKDFAQWRVDVTGSKEEVYFSDTAAEVDIEKFHLTEKIKTLILNGWQGNGHRSRSEADEAVIVALLSKGATDDEIRGIFQSYPVGQKYREKGAAGDKYLAHSIARAKEYISSTESEAGGGSGDGAAQTDTTRVLPKINAGDLNLARVADAAWDVLVAANRPPFLFRYGAVIARIETDDQGAPVVRIVTENKLRHALARVAWWYTIKKNADAEKPALPPLHVVRDMLARPEPPLPVLTRIVDAPVFASDGTLCVERGYHERARVVFAGERLLRMRAVIQSPSAQDIERAREMILHELLGDFPFVGDAERAHAVSLKLLPFAREFIEGPTPLHLIEKPSPGTGGTLLAEVLLFPAIGRLVPVMSEAKDEDEWRKRITAKLMRGPAVVLIDNIRRRLESSALSTAITGLIFEDRIMGHSEMVNIPVRCAWVATGNNPALSSEMSRRTVRIRLDAKVDRPWLREGFRHPNLREWVSENRPEIVHAALTLIQTWIAAGRPEGKTALGMFEQWSRVMGGILAVAGIDGFLSNLEEFYDESDAEGEAWRTFVARWWEKYKAKEVGVADLYPLVSPADEDPIDLDLGDGSERSQKIRLGKRLAEIRDRQFGGFRIIKAGTRDRAQTWRLKS